MKDKPKQQSQGQNRALSDLKRLFDSVNRGEEVPAALRSSLKAIQDHNLHLSKVRQLVSGATISKALGHSLRLGLFELLYETVLEALLDEVLEECRFRPIPRTLTENPLWADRKAKHLLGEVAGVVRGKPFDELEEKIPALEQLVAEAVQRGLSIGFEPRPGLDFKLDGVKRDTNVDLEHAMVLLRLVADPDLVSKVFQCAYCGDFAVATYRRRQKFCKKACNTHWHYRENPERHKERVRRWRKRNA